MPIAPPAPLARIEPETALGGRRPRFFYLVTLPLWFAVVLRSFDAEGDGGQRPVVFGLLLLFLALFVTSDWVSRRYRWYQNIYFGLQLAIVALTMDAQPELDFFPVLLIPVSAQIALLPKPMERRFWFAATFLVMASGLLVFQEFPGGLGLISLFAASYIVIGSYASITEQKESAEAQERALVAELQTANQQLRENAERIENLAIVEERNRLARELHDSVSQSLYGLMLSSEAARRNLASGFTDGISEELDAMSEAARTALAEMRLLIYELRPSDIEELGLHRALETRLATVERRAGLQTALDYQVTSDLPLRTEIELERIAAEALTNAVRHSGASEVRVLVRQDRNRVVLEVRDDGSGFEAGTASTGFGLRGMRERAERLGGILAIESAPNEGTCVRVDAPL